MGQELKQFSEERISSLAKDAYCKGDAGFEVDRSKTALLVIDMQNEFVRPNASPYWVPDATRMMPRLAGLIDAAHKAGIPVIHTAFIHSHALLDRPASGKFMPNRYSGISYEEPADANDFVAELKPCPEDVVIFKPSYGAFYDTPLDTILRNLGCDTVIVTGTLSNVCCGMTARQAYERGYKVVFGSDVTATNDREMHEAELRVLRYGFAKVMSAEEICADIHGIAEQEAGVVQ